MYSEHALWVLLVLKVLLLIQHTMVQLCVHVEPGPPDTYEFLDCNTETYIEEIKKEIASLGKQSGEYSLKADMLELWFMDEECKNGKQLKDYAICHEWIVQAAGFTIKLRK